MTVDSAPLKPKRFAGFSLFLGGKPPRDEDLVYEPLVKTSTRLFYLMSSVAAAGLLTAFGFLFVNYRFRHHR